MNEFFYILVVVVDDTEANEINEKTDFKNLDEWDSMTTLMLIAMVDEKYERQINGADIKESITLEDLHTRIQAK